MVSLKQKKTGVALRVEDNGCGLMEEDPIENNRRFLSGAKLGLRTASSSAAVQAGS